MYYFFVAHFLCMPGCSCLCLITYQTLLGSLLLCCKNFFLFILQQRRETVCKTLELKPDETSYTDIMHRLVKRYLFKLERAKDEKENGKLHTLESVAGDVILSPRDLPTMLCTTSHTGINTAMRIAFINISLVIKVYLLPL